MESNIGIKIDTDNTTNATSSSGCVTTDIQRALAALHLPLRPGRAEIRNAHDGGKSDPPKPSANQHPSISILVCADFDLQSTAALAEYALQQQNKIFDSKSIDLIVAAGPSHSGTEILKYYQGNHKFEYVRNHEKLHGNRFRNSLSENNIEPLYIKDSGRGDYPRLASTEPFFRSKEESAALEGLITAALSQLESIVCRVVYCPGWNDPISLLQQRQPKRLTSHSHNIHQHYLPLAPGLGCSGLFYVDNTNELIENYKRNRSEMSGMKNYSISNHQRNSADDDDSESSEQEDGYTLLSEQIKKLQPLPIKYYESLEKLLQLAPQPNYPKNLFNSKNKGQSFIVTHYIDSQSLIDGEKLSLNDVCDDDNEDDIFDEIFELNNPLNNERKNNTAVNVSDDTKDNGYNDCSWPWPNGHEDFLNSTIARQNLCFEIATGLSSKYRRPEWIPFPSFATLKTDDVDEGSVVPGPGVLLPGSLCERGDFCVVHLSLVEQQSSIDTNDQNYYLWEVQAVDFHSINKF